MPVTYIRDSTDTIRYDNRRWSSVCMSMIKPSVMVKYQQPLSVDVSFRWTIINRSVYYQTTDLPPWTLSISSSNCNTWKCLNQFIQQVSCLKCVDTKSATDAWRCLSLIWPCVEKNVFFCHTLMFVSAVIDGTNHFIAKDAELISI